MDKIDLLQNIYGFTTSLRDSCFRGRQLRDKSILFPSRSQRTKRGLRCSPLAIRPPLPPHHHSPLHPLCSVRERSVSRPCVRVPPRPIPVRPASVAHLDSRGKMGTVPDEYYDLKPIAHKPDVHRRQIIRLQISWRTGRDRISWHKSMGFDARR